METAIKRMKETAMKMKRTASWLSKVVVIALVAAGGLLGISTSATAADGLWLSGQQLHRREQSAHIGQTAEQALVARRVLVGRHVDHRHRLADLPAGRCHRRRGSAPASRMTPAPTRWRTRSGTARTCTSLRTSSRSPATRRPVPSVSGQPAKLYRYSYSGGSFTLDSGFPTTIMNNSSESMTIDQDSTGAIWATWTQVAGNSTAATPTPSTSTAPAPAEPAGTHRLSPCHQPQPCPGRHLGGRGLRRQQDRRHVERPASRGSVRWATRTDGTNATAASSWRVQDAIKGNKHRR